MNSKQWYQSKTMLFNGILLVGATFVQIVDILTGANVLEPLVKVFVKDPENATKVIAVVTQVYSLANLYLRTKTNQGVTFSGNEPRNP